MLQAAPWLHPIFLGIACANPYAALTCPAYAGAAQIAVGGSTRDALRAFNLGLGSAAAGGVAGGPVGNTDGAGGSSLGAQVSGYINAENDLPDNDNGNTKTRSTARVIQVSDTGGSLSNGAAAGAFVNLFQPGGTAMMGIYDVPDAPTYVPGELDFLIEDIVRQAGEPVLVALFVAVDLTLFTPGVPDATLLVLASWQGTRVVAGAARTVLRDPSKIRYIQDSIGWEFRDRRTVQALIDGLRSGRILANDVKSIRVFWRRGKLWTLDNRRLFAFQQAGVNVRTRLATQQEISRAIARGKFTTRNDGLSVRVRGGPR